MLVFRSGPLYRNLPQKTTIPPRCISSLTSRRGADRKKGRGLTCLAGPHLLWSLGASSYHPKFLETVLCLAKEGEGRMDSTARAWTLPAPAPSQRARLLPHLVHTHTWGSMREAYCRGPTALVPMA